MDIETQSSGSKISFDTFYREVFLPEHRNRVNVALHMVGTIAGLVYVIAVLAAPWSWWWLLLLFPVVHAAPGLVGHRLLERNGAVGDARFLRTDYPGWWFLAGNHRMTAEKLMAPLLRRSA